VANDLIVKIKEKFVPTDFMILDMGNGKNIPLIIGRPFLSTINACIFVASGQMEFQIGSSRLHFTFGEASKLPYLQDQHKKKNGGKKERFKKKQDDEKKDPSSIASSPDPVVKGEENEDEEKMSFKGEITIEEKQPWEYTHAFCI